MKLKEAIELYRKEKGASSNSYNWYRQSAQERGQVWINRYPIAAFKEKGQWHVDDEEFHKALDNHRKQQNWLLKATEDYSNGIYHGEPGDTIKTEWGGYRIYEDFRFVWSYSDVLRKRSYGSWYCRHCDNLADKENNKEECHTCRDWGDCGSDCTLSKVICPKCMNEKTF